MKVRLLLAQAICLCATLANAQSFSSAMEYVDYMSGEHQKVSVAMWSYTSAVAHGKRARKVESRRRELVEILDQATRKISKMPGFEGDVAFRDSLVAYLQLSAIVITQDYSRIVDMEAISEQSYDHVEAYMTAQGIANQKLDAASGMVGREQLAFATKHNITITDGKDELDQDLGKAGKVFKYYNEIYLVYFKNYKQEMYLLEAVRKEDINALEQNRNALVDIATRGLAQLDTTKAFDGDASVKVACQDLLQFYQEEATVEVPLVVDFLLKKETLARKQAALEGETASRRTQEDTGEYNRLVATYNTTIAKLAAERNAACQNWDQAVQDFLDKHVPGNN